MNWLKKQSTKNPNKKFINDFTFYEVYNRVLELSGKLYKYVKNESRVVIYSNNNVDMVLFFLALQYLEKEVLMLNTRLTDGELKNQLNTLNIKVVFSNDNTFIPFQEVYENEKEEIKVVEEFNYEQIAVIMNTSATTGKFKSVPIRWKQLNAHVVASKKALGAMDEDNWLCVLPMYHIGGLAILFRSLYNGTRLTIMESFDENFVAQLIENNKINMLSIVPTMLFKIINKIDKHALRVVLVGGEFIPKALVEQSLLKNIPIYKTYGMTETCSQSTTFSVLEYTDKIDSVGLPLFGTRIKIVNQDDYGVGEIHIKSPMLMDGYINQEKINGYFNTEDFGYIDNDGFLYILERRKNIIISGGENIYPKEIEDILYTHPQVKECAVVGKKDDKWGQRPVLYIVSKLDKDTIIKYLSDKLAKYKLPKEIIYVDKLPKSSIGKILKKEL